jgi:hypothetical protein
MGGVSRPSALGSGSGEGWSNALPAAKRGWRSIRASPEVPQERAVPEDAPKEARRTQ